MFRRRMSPFGPTRTSRDVGLTSALEGRNRLDLFNQRFSVSEPKGTWKVPLSCAMRPGPYRGREALASAAVTSSEYSLPKCVRT